jgi:glycosyltransferase involved in cell wall biosynthesis
MKIAYVYVRGRLARLAEARAGLAAREFFYGALELEDHGHQVELYEVDSGPDAPAGSPLIELLYKLHLTPSKTNAPLVKQLQLLLPALNSCDVAVATASGPAYGLALLSAFGQLRVPLIAIHCGIANHSLKVHRRIINSRLLRRSWNMIYGEGEEEPIRHMYRLPSERLRVNQFGVDTKFWRPCSSPNQDYILAVGNDVRRDYQLLLQLALKIPKRILVVSRQNLGELPENVTQIQGDWHAQTLSDEGLRGFYQEAALVVTPLIDSVQPAGQSVCLQAMACGKPVVLTETRGLWSRAMMRDRYNVLLVPPHDIDALHQAIAQLLSSPEECKRLGENGIKTTCEQANIALFASRIHALAAEITH